MNRVPRRLAVAAACGAGALVLGWCLLRSPAPSFDEDRAARLLAEVEPWWSPNGDFRSPAVIDQSEVGRLNPSQVRVTVEGVWLVKEKFFVTESGVFVLPTGSTYRPPEQGDPSFKRLAGRVYWYHISG